MTTSSRQPIFTNIYSRIQQSMTDWGELDKVSLMGRLMMYEALTHWIWLVFIIYNFYKFRPYVQPFYLVVLFFGCTLFILTIWVLNEQIYKLEHLKRRFVHHQMTMLVAYITYISGFLILIGQDSFVSGIFLSSAIIGLLLIEKTLMWRFFLVHCFIIVCLIVLPYWIGELPSLRNTVLASTEPAENHRFFWRISELYFGLPKAIAIFYTVIKLLDGIEHRKKLIRYRAEFDELTRVRNRHGIIEVARDNLYGRVNRYDASVILIDLDHFKQINDVYGHLAGDKVLYQVAQLFKKHLPDNAYLGRYGGEEFLVLLPNTETEKAAGVAHKLRLELAATPIAIGNGLEIALTASFGIASLHIDCIDFIYNVYRKVSTNTEFKRQFNVEFTEVLKFIIDKADNALYNAKSKGRNRVMVTPVIKFDQLEHIGSFNKHRHLYKNLTVEGVGN